MGYRLHGINCVTPRFSPQSESNQIDKFQNTNSQTIKIENLHKKDLTTQSIKSRNPRESNAQITLKCMQDT